MRPSACQGSGEGCPGFGCLVRVLAAVQDHCTAKCVRVLVISPFESKTVAALMQLDKNKDSFCPQSNLPGLDKRNDGV